MKINRKQVDKYLLRVVGRQMAMIFFVRKLTLPKGRDLWSEWFIRSKVNILQL